MRLAASLPVPPDLLCMPRRRSAQEELGYESLWIADTGAGPDAFVVAARRRGRDEARPHRDCRRPDLHATPSGLRGAARARWRSSRPGASCSASACRARRSSTRWGGVPFRRPLARVRETVHDLRQMLAGERVTFEGKWHRHARLPPGVAAARARADLRRGAHAAHARAGGRDRRRRDPQLHAGSRRSRACWRTSASRRRARRPRAVDARGRRALPGHRHGRRRGRARRRSATCSGPTSRRRSTTRSWPGAASRPRPRRSSPRWRAKDRAANLAAVTDDMIDRIAIIGTGRGVPRASCRRSHEPASRRRWSILSCSTRRADLARCSRASAPGLPRERLCSGPHDDTLRASALAVRAEGEDRARREERAVRDADARHHRRLGSSSSRALNPRLEVPALVDGDDTIFDSTIILEYIEERWPTPPLLPASPPRARACA